jgi:hypothetical protein
VIQRLFLVLQLRLMPFVLDSFWVVQSSELGSTSEMANADVEAFMTRLKRTEARRTSGFVYFVQCEQFVKIGYSETPRWRPHDFATGNPFECRLIGLLEGGLDRERDLHKKFSEFRHRGEWFVLTGGLRSEIADMCGNWEHLAPEFKTPREQALEEMKKIPIRFDY